MRGLPLATDWRFPTQRAANNYTGLPFPAKQFDAPGCGSSSIQFYRSEEQPKSLLAVVKTFRFAQAIFCKQGANTLRVDFSLEQYRINKERRVLPRLSLLIFTAPGRN